MRIIVEIGHPGHVHHFKNMIWQLEEKGHQVKICSMDKEITLDLLNRYNFEHEVLGVNKGKGILGKLPLILGSDLKMLKIVRKFKPDMFICRGSPISAHISKLFRKSCISFSDTEHAQLAMRISFPFIDTVLTPSCYKTDLGEKQVRYEGYHELAYLHPNNFTPNPSVLDELGLDEGEKFVIMRFVSWGAHHDVGHYGIQNKIEFVKEMEKHSKVFISSEGELEDELKKYQVKISPEKMHDLLYYASLYVGDGGTTAVEGAILGTPSIYISSLVGSMGNFIELEDKYGLMLSFKDSNAALNKAAELMQNPDVKNEWKQKRNKLLEDKIDVTAFMVQFVENY